MMDARELIEEIRPHLDEGYKAREDMFVLLRGLLDEDVDYVVREIETLRESIVRGVAEAARQEDYDTVRALDDLRRDTYFLTGRYKFEDFMIGLEYDRPAEEKFYEPRRHVLKRVAQAMQDLSDDKLDELFLSMPPRVGKLLADDTPVLTTDGWKTHGDLKVGDYVYSPTGDSVEVIAVHPKNRADIRVELTDGSVFYCHENHEWFVYDRRFGEYRTLETKYMMKSVENGKEKGHARGHRYNFMLPLKTAIKGVEKTLPVPPYTFGAWLGDGTNKKPMITGDVEDQDIVRRIMDDGYQITKVYTHKTSNVVSTHFDTSLRCDLQKIGLCHSRHIREKYIPDIYLGASKEQRLQLLAGLIDTDGSLSKKENRYSFTTSEKSLKDSFVSLVNTFGWRAAVSEKKPRISSSGIIGKKTYWTISFNPTEYIPCVLKRKQLYSYSKQRRIAIKSITRVNDGKIGNCITVDGGLYLVGKNMVTTHNSTLCMWYTLWTIGRDPEASNLYVSYTDGITRAFYTGLLEVINDPYTYNYKKIFSGVSMPTAKNGFTNAQDETIDIGRRKRYHSITCRSLYGTLNGACDAKGILISDDLVGSIEEALSKDRLIGVWAKVDNNMIPRAKEKAKLLWVGTRWSLIDPAGIRMDLLENDDRFKSRRYKIINLPALDENDESNFDYDYGVGYSTEHYQERRASFERNNDMASWNAQYMGQPIEREGTVFSPEDMRYFNGVLPDDKPDRKFMAVDPAWGGGDYVASPVCYQYGDDIYVVDVVYNNEDKRVTQRLLAQAVDRYEVDTMMIEASKTTAEYKDGVEENITTHCTITTKTAPNDRAKWERVLDKAPDIREHFIFLEDGKRSRDYSLFMQNVYSFKIAGKNKNDDAPDSLCMAVDMAFRGATNSIEIFRRPF